MFNTLKKQRNEAKEKLNHWLGSVSNAERTVTRVSNGYDCNSYNRYDIEFLTVNLNDALNYLYPEY